ncbi:MAG: hypothetical protein HQ572_02860, partial [Candidatus Omnitrophica bacterium]|nr:hypothetical protein [Candidatus Omnitrophota bacterium]
KKRRSKIMTNVHILILKIFILIIAYRAYCYEKRRGFLSSANKLYNKYIADQTTLEKPEILKDSKLSKKYGKSYQQLLSKKTTIRKYILEAGIKEVFLPVIQPVQGGGISKTTFSVLEYPYQINTDGVGDYYYRGISEAIGHYKHRRNESFNPFFWIELMIFLPKQLAGYAGISSKVIVNLSQAVYWLILALGAYFKLLR